MTGVTQDIAVKRLRERNERAADLKEMSDKIIDQMGTVTISLASLNGDMGETSPRLNFMEVHHRYEPIGDDIEKITITITGYVEK